MVKRVTPMRSPQIWLISLLMVLTPAAASVHPAYAEQEAPPAGLAPPPVAQPLVREGDFAVRLVTALDLGQTSNEAEAESILTQAGIAPSNGWIADYPVTPDVVTEVLQGIRTAADSGRIAISEADAEQAFDRVTTGLGLAIAPAPEQAQQQAVSNAPPPDNTLYTSPTTVNNYYYQYGPPVVTYYPPPLDYSYLYVWVPFPFFYLDFWFPGYYCLHDFDRVVVVVPHVRVISNHWFDPHRHGYVIVRPPYWCRYPGRHDRDHHDGYHRERFSEPPHGFSSVHGRRDAEVVLHRRMQRQQGDGTFTALPPGTRRPEGIRAVRPGVERPEGPRLGTPVRLGREERRDLARPAPSAPEARTGRNAPYGPSSPALEHSSPRVGPAVRRAPSQRSSRDSSGAVGLPRPQPPASFNGTRDSSSPSPAPVRTRPSTDRHSTRAVPPRAAALQPAGNEAMVHSGGPSSGDGRSPGIGRNVVRPSLPEPGFTHMRTVDRSLPAQPASFSSPRLRSSNADQGRPAITGFSGGRFTSGR
jgi:hypothetical protein